MKLLLVLCLVLYIQVARSKVDVPKYDSLDEEWAKFKVEYNKSYESPAEEAKRKQIFADNLLEINRHNRRYEQRKETYVKGINQFADLLPSEVPMGFRNDDRSRVRDKRPPGFIPTRPKRV